MTPASIPGFDISDNTPPWAVDPLARFVSASLAEQQLLRDACLSIQLTTSIWPKLDTAFTGMAKQLPKAMVEQWTENRPSSERLVGVLNSEVEAEFQTLLRMQAVALWAALEVAIEDLVAAFLENDRALATQPRLTKIDVPFPFWTWTAHERRAHLLRELKRTIGTNSPGRAQFEELLQVVNLAGSVPQNVRRDLIELSQVRHVIVHREARCDKRIIEVCPWLTYQVGSTISISRDDSDRWVEAATMYVAGVVARVVERFSDDVADEDFE